MINTRSIRFRLTFWFSVALVVSTGIIFTIFYLITRNALWFQTNATISSHGAKVVEVLTRDEQRMHNMYSQEAFLQEFGSIPGMVLLVVGGNGSVINSSFQIGQTDAAVLFHDVETHRDPFFLDRSISESHVRFWVFPLWVNRVMTTSVFVGHNVDIIDTALRQLLVTLALVYLVLAIPSVVVASLLARSALFPIVCMSEQVAHISSDRLDERIDTSQTGDELERLGETFNDLLDRMYHAFDRERRFIGDVAHELKTPLSALRGSFELALSKTRTAAHYQTMLSETLVDVERLQKTIQNLLDLAWSKTHPRDTKKLVDVSAVIDEVLEIARKLAGQKDIGVNASIRPHVFVIGERDKIFRAILNIVDNAVHYTSRGRIRISLKKVDNKAKIVITDSGIGIGSRDLPHIFDRFYRGEHAAQTSGSGLGLAIAQSIVNAFSGTIDVKSRVGRGTTVTISFPVVDEKTDVLMKSS